MNKDKCTYPALMLLLIAAGCCMGDSPIGVFDGHGDVGTVLHAGSVVFDASTRSYTVTASGENMWSTADAFQFVWKKVSGDVILTADISFPTKSGDAHKKAVVMIRQSLDAGSAYADAALHGNGLTSLQARDQAGAATHEIQANVTAPRRLRIEKRGAYVYMSVGQEGGDPHFSGGSMRVQLTEPFYVGIGACSHNKDAEEQAVFSNVDLKKAPNAVSRLYSTIETITVSSTDRRVTAVMPERLAAANWSRDGSIFFERDGRIARIPVDGGEPRMIGAEAVDGHGVSRDGSSLGYGGRGGIFVIPLAGGTARRVLEKAATFHGWSPDGRSVLLSWPSGIYTVPVEGGKETQVSTGEDRNDNPEFSADSKYVYFNSERSGTMQIWRMLADGSSPEQLTADALSNCFPHVSPDGLRIVFLSYDGDDGYPRDRDVMLRMMSIGDKKLSVLAKLRGGVGTLNAAPWSPDGRRVVLVSYQEKP